MQRGFEAVLARAKRTDVTALIDVDPERDGPPGGIQLGSPPPPPQSSALKRNPTTRMPVPTTETKTAMRRGVRTFRRMTISGRRWP